MCANVCKSRRPEATYEGLLVFGGIRSEVQLSVLHPQSLLLHDGALVDPCYHRPCLQAAVDSNREIMSAVFPIWHQVRTLLQQLELGTFVCTCIGRGWEAIILLQVSHLP
eukprot:68995-Amphidinium_carterae.1